MSSKTKIVVLRMKEIIYTAIFIGFGILLILLLLVMFRPGKGACLRKHAVHTGYLHLLHQPGIPGGQCRGDSRRGPDHFHYHDPFK